MAKLLKTAWKQQYIDCQKYWHFRDITALTLRVIHKYLAAWERDGYYYTGEGQDTQLV